MSFNQPEFEGACTQTLAFVGRAEVRVRVLRSGRPVVQYRHGCYVMKQHRRMAFDVCG